MTAGSTSAQRAYLLFQSRELGQRSGLHRKDGSASWLNDRTDCISDNSQATVGFVRCPDHQTSKSRAKHKGPVWESYTATPSSVAKLGNGPIAKAKYGAAQ
ncbi:MAG: hypothetical protein ABJO27_06180 [Pseudoruegeria sp.]